MTKHTEEKISASKNKFKIIKTFLFALLIGGGVILIGYILMSFFGTEASTTKQSNDDGNGTKYDDAKVCSKMEEIFIEYLQEKQNIKILKFKFDSGVTYEDMGLSGENVTKLAVVNAANTELSPGYGGLNKGITSWVLDKKGIDASDGNERWYGKTEYTEGQIKDTKNLGLAAYSQFEGGIILHVIGPQAKLVGNLHQCKNLSEVTEVLTKAYGNCLKVAIEQQCSHIIYTVVSSGLYCDGNAKMGFKKSEFLLAVHDAVKNFVENDFGTIKVYFNV
ncbi:hypothetical protein LUQ84_3638 [Hamiltosporidium tvaerminnensis]|nr:hypothetical protein LUQ84_3638 [Hamiltosporidium tvaerminnensis]